MRVTIELEFIEKYDPEKVVVIIASCIQELIQDGSLSYTVHVEEGKD